MPAFYKNLFTAHPEFKPLFSNDIRTQHKKLLMAMVTVIESLKDDKVPWTPILSHLGHQHQKVQVKPEFFALFRQVMLQTMAEFLGEQWTSEVEQTWEDALTLIMDHMVKGYL